MKKFACMLLLCAALLLCATAASAEESFATVTGKLISEGACPDVKKVYSRSSMDELEEYLISQLSSGKGEIDVKKYAVPEKTFTAFYWDMLNRHPELFYVAGQLSYYTSSGYMSSILPQYLFSGTDLQNRIEEFENHVSNIVSYAASASSDIGKLIRINDYFCVNYQYDLSYSVYRPDLLFNGKTGVCQAYMLGYAAVLNELGIENTYATSDAMNHIWNMVKLDGEWYHIDVTWNDPVADLPMRARHYYFLLSDEGFLNAGHYDWESAVVADSGKYDEYFWRDLDTPLAVSGDNVYYFSYGTDSSYKRSIYKYDCSEETSVRIHSFGITSGYYPGFMALAADGSFLYYGEGSKLYSIGMEGGTPALIYAHDNSNECIWSAWREGSRIRLLVGASLNGRIITVDIPNWTSELVILPSVAEVEIGKTVQLRLVAPENPSLAITGSWISDDISVAAVNGKGLVTGVGMGITNVSAMNGLEYAEAVVIVHSNQRIDIPESTVSVEEEAFAGISAEEILIPYGVEAIGERAFADCTELKMITIPETVTAIGEDAFEGCGEEMVILTREGSFAQSYAEANEIDFVLIG